MSHININEIGIEERKSIMLTIMDSVDAFCKEKGIRYTLAGGSMLGAIRHKGYIPWDDDIDICMHREEYEKFITTFNTNYENIELQCLATNKDFYLPYGKVVDNRTILIEDDDWDNPMHVGIDVFPLDNCFDSLERSYKYIDSFKKYYWLKNFKLIKVSKNRKLWKNVVLVGGKVITIGISRNVIARLLSIKAQQRNNSPSNYIAEIVNNAYGHREVFPAKWFTEFEEVEFEGRYYLASKNYKEILTQVFGNYLELPPVENRINHNAISFWK